MVMTLVNRYHSKMAVSMSKMAVSISSMGDSSEDINIPLSVAKDWA